MSVSTLATVRALASIAVVCLARRMTDGCAVASHAPYVTIDTQRVGSVKLQSYRVQPC
jgi:hypothetical protein